MDLLEFTLEKLSTKVKTFLRTTVNRTIIACLVRSHFIPNQHPRQDQGDKNSNNQRHYDAHLIIKLIEIELMRMIRVNRVGSDRLC